MAFVPCWTSCPQLTKLTYDTHTHKIKSKTVDLCVGLAAFSFIFIIFMPLKCKLWYSNRERERERGIDWLQRSSDVMLIAASHLWKSIHVSTLTLIIYPPQINTGEWSPHLLTPSDHNMKTLCVYLSQHLISVTQEKAGGKNNTHYSSSGVNTRFL